MLLLHQVPEAMLQEQCHPEVFEVSHPQQQTLRRNNCPQLSKEIPEKRAERCSPPVEVN